MTSMAGFDLPVAVTRKYISSAITLIIHLARLKGGVRRVMRVSEITALENGDYAIQDLFGFEQCGADDRGIARGHFYATGNRPFFLKKLNQIGIEIPDKLFAQKQLTPDSAIAPMSNLDPSAAHVMREDAE
jgi:pilus assembly protein CpaF